MIFIFIGLSFFVIFIVVIMIEGNNSLNRIEKAMKLKFEIESEIRLRDSLKPYEKVSGGYKYLNNN